jgi:hypothetical protein
MTITVRRLMRLVQKFIDAGMDPDAPVLILTDENPAVSSKSGRYPNAVGWYGRRNNHREAMYIALDDPREKPAPEWDSTGGEDG